MPVAHAGGKNAPDEETQERARALWEAAVEAKGGRELLHKIGSLYVVRAQPAGDQDYQLFVFPDYSFNYTYGGHLEDIAKEVYNGKKGITWWVTPSGAVMPRRSSEGDAAGNIIAQFTYLMVTNWMEPKPLRARDGRVGFRRVDVVEVDADGWRVDYYLDPKTHLPAQVVSAYGQMSHDKGEMSQVVRLGDYKEVSGVMMPQEVSYSYTTNPTKRKEHISYEINPPYDPQFFENPPSVRTGPEAWRLKAGRSSIN